MRQEPIRLFSRAAALLLMMMLTASTAWATDYTVTYLYGEVRPLG